MQFCPKIDNQNIVLQPALQKCRGHGTPDHFYMHMVVGAIAIVGCNLHCNHSFVMGKGLGRDRWHGQQVRLLEGSCTTPSLSLGARTHSCSTLAAMGIRSPAGARLTPGAHHCCALCTGPSDHHSANPASQVLGWALLRFEHNVPFVLCSLDTCVEQQLSTLNHWCGALFGKTETNPDTAIQRTVVPPEPPTVRCNPL